MWIFYRPYNLPNISPALLQSGWMFRIQQCCKRQIKVSCFYFMSSLMVYILQGCNPTLDATRSFYVYHLEAGRQFIGGSYTGWSISAGDGRLLRLEITLREQLEGTKQSWCGPLNWWIITDSDLKDTKCSVNCRGWEVNIFDSQVIHR